MMNKREILRNILLGLGALVLMAVLAFLYDRTQTVDMRDRGEVLEGLRALKEIDGRWDLEVLRARLESGSGPQLIVRREPAERPLRRLEAAARKTPSASLAAGLPELRTAILGKEELVEKFRTENAGAKAALAELFRGVSEARSQAAKGARSLPELDAALSRLTAAASQYFWFAQAAQSDLMKGPPERVPLS